MGAPIAESGPGQVLKLVVFPLLGLPDSSTRLICFRQRAGSTSSYGVCHLFLKD
jgi:hypothetical protein